MGRKAPCCHPNCAQRAPLNIPIRWDSPRLIAEYSGSGKPTLSLAYTDRELSFGRVFGIFFRHSNYVLYFTRIFYKMQ